MSVLTSRHLHEPRLPSRLPACTRVQTRIGYAWRNSGHPLVRKARRHWDSRRWARQPVVRSELAGLVITYAGLRDGQAYTLEFTEQRRETTNSDTAVRTAISLPPRDILHDHRIPDSDIVIIGATAADAGQLPADSAFILPMRVHFVVDYDDSVDNVMARIAKGERRNFRQRLRQHTWHLTIDRDPEWFDYFYEHIYRATMAARHGARERVETPTSAHECLFREGILFVLSMDGQRVGGHLCHWDRERGVLTSRLLGVRDGDENLYAAGALKVMHSLLIQWAGEHGVRQLDFQGTEPFLSKGTYQLKRLFGTRVTLPPNHFGDKRLWLQVRRDTPQVRDFLVANPFLSLNRAGGFEAVYFHDDQRASRTDYKSNSPGVTRVRDIHLDEFFATANVTSPGVTAAPKGT